MKPEHLTWLVFLQQQIGWWQHFWSSPAAVFSQHGIFYHRHGQISTTQLDFFIVIVILHLITFKLPCDISIGLCTAGQCDWIWVLPFCPHNYTQIEKKTETHRHTFIGMSRRTGLEPFNICKMNNRKECGALIGHTTFRKVVELLCSGEADEQKPIYPQWQGLLRIVWQQEEEVIKKINHFN